MERSLGLKKINGHDGRINLKHQRGSIVLKRGGKVSPRGDERTILVKIQPGRGETRVPEWYQSIELAA